MPPKRNYKRKRNPKGFVAIPFSESLALSTLADNTVVKGSLLAGSLGEDLFCLSTDMQISMRDATPGQGPIFVGIAHGDLSASEILEAIDASLLDPDDIIAKEQARRPVRKLGYFSVGAESERLNQGVTKRTKMRFSIGDGHTVASWAVNRSGATLTTGNVLRFTGTLYGRWQR